MKKIKEITNLKFLFIIVLLFIIQFIGICISPPSIGIFQNYKNFFNLLCPLVISIEVVVLGLVFGISNTYLNKVLTKKVEIFFTRQKIAVITIFVFFVVMNILLIFLEPIFLSNEYIKIPDVYKIILIFLALLISLSILTTQYLFLLIDQQINYYPKDKKLFEEQKANVDTVIKWLNDKKEQEKNEKKKLRRNKNK